MSEETKKKIIDSGLIEKNDKIPSDFFDDGNNNEEERDRLVKLSEAKNFSIYQKGYLVINARNGKLKAKKIFSDIRKTAK